ncbi:MAG: hypothetical protein D6744_01205 [Planctomycetota bacterium]|nr:MAG: hypothetical protein D6744_01205 [Planctomycetota bacterium]
MTVVANAPATAKSGETVAISAAIDGAEAANVSYEWYQTFGRVVSLSQATGSEVTFVAPSLASAQTLRFRVDARDGNRTLGSATVEVVVEVDPGVEIEPSDGGGTADPHPKVRIVTIKGLIDVELDREAAPITVENFLRYVDDGFYEGTIFHRVIPDFVIQGGGYTVDLELKETRAPIINESNNGLKNDRGTIAMARTNDPDSATSQFYINLVDNDSLNYRDGSPGYAVFGRVIDGMDVVDQIAQEPTESRDGLNDVPVETMIILAVERLDE